VFRKKLEKLSSSLHYYVQKHVKLLSLLSINKCVVFFIVFKQRLSSVFFIFLSALFISLNFPFVCIQSLFCLSRLHFASLNRMTSFPPVTPDDRGFTVRILETFHKPHIGGILFLKKILTDSQIYQITRIKST
jgi:hypothetical protein